MDLILATENALDVITTFVVRMKQQTIAIPEYLDIHVLNHHVYVAISCKLVLIWA